MKFVYVVYRIENNDFEDLRIFEDYAEAKWFVNHQNKKYKIHQKSIDKGGYNFVKENDKWKQI